MKRLIIAASLALTPLSACTANQMLESAPVIGNVCAAADRVLIDEKVEFAAQTLFNIPADAYRRAVVDGHLPPGPDRERLKVMLIKADDLRIAIRNGRGAVNCDFAAMKALHADIMKMLPRR